MDHDPAPCCWMTAVLWIALVCALIGRDIGRSRGRVELGAVLGFLLGPLGLLIVYVIPPTVRAEIERRDLVERELELRRAARELERLRSTPPQPGPLTDEEQFRAWRAQEGRERQD